jgi:DNA-binding MarR family transcriptional regulator
VAERETRSEDCAAEAIAALTAWTLIRAHHAVARRFNEVFADAALTPTQFGVLAQLTTAPGLIQSELARRVLVRPQTMGELLASLLERGLVRREGPGGRGRAAAVTITDRGREVLAAALPRVRAFNDPATLGLTAEQAHTLNSLLHTVCGALSDPPGRGSGDRR